MKYSYKGKDYFLELTAEGKVRNGEFDISADTAAEVQAEIRKQVDAERSKTGKIKILTFGDRHTVSGTEYYEGTTTNIGNHWSVWVSWKEDGENRRAKLSRNSFWPDTPENRAVLDKICEIHKRVQDLNEQIDILSEQLTTLPES